MHRAISEHTKWGSLSESLRGSQSLRKVRKPLWACCSLVAVLWTPQNNSLGRVNLGVLQYQNYSFTEDDNPKTVSQCDLKHMVLLCAHMRKAIWWLLCHLWAGIMWAKPTISWENSNPPSCCHLQCCSPAWIHSLSKLGDTGVIQRHQEGPSLREAVVFRNFSSCVEELYSSLNTLWRRRQNTKSEIIKPVRCFSSFLVFYQPA